MKKAKKREIQECEVEILSTKKDSKKDEIIVADKDHVFKPNNSVIDNERDVFTQVAISNIESDFLDDDIEEGELNKEDEEIRAVGEVIGAEEKEQKIKDIFG